MLLARIGPLSVALVAVCGVWASAQPVAPSATQPVPAAIRAATVPEPYAWRGHESDIETYLRTAPVVRVEDIPVGVTRPRRAYFAPGGPVGSIAWKVLPDQVLHGKVESHRSEIAAYRLSRLLALDMVPPAVERAINGVKGAGIYWVEGVRPWNPSKPPAISGINWSRQTSRMFMFDQLIANIDRNQGNLLYDDDGHMYLIDHSRAFTPRPDLTGLHAPQQFDRDLWERMAALSREDLDGALGACLSSLQIEAILTRRDAMARVIERRVKAKGERVVFLPRAPGEGVQPPGY